MSSRVRVAAALIFCLFGLAACGFGPRPDGLPAPPDDETAPIVEPPSTTLDAYGPAGIDLKQFSFEETGQHTEVDLERTRPGITDLFYNHISGRLEPINGAKVWLYDKDGSWWGDEPHVRSDYPGEQECRLKPDGDWQDTFRDEDLAAGFSIYCIKTADNSYGFLYVKPIEDKKPNAYYVYTWLWVR